MPRFDKTGPRGQGPKTGRGAGPCGDGTSRGGAPGRGLGMGQGRGLGRGAGFGRGGGLGLGRGAGRPIKQREVRFNPDVTYFKPRAVPLAEIEEVGLGIDELEAMRLCDVDGLDQEEAAKKMGISQSTLQRIIVSARKKVAEALVEGKAITIEEANQ